MTKKLKGGTLWPRPVLYVTRETFLVQLLGPMGTIWRLLKILVELLRKNYFGHFSCIEKKKNFKKTLTKSHDYSRHFSLEKRRLKRVKNA